MLSSGQSPGPAKCTITRSYQAIWLGIICFLCWATLGLCMKDDDIRKLREETKELFYHGYHNYMKHAFPEDELRSVTCGPLTRDRENPNHIAVNDVLGNYSLTLVDSLSTLAIFASSPADTEGSNYALETFQDGVALLVEYYGDGTKGPGGKGRRARGYDLDSKVQVFETVIRGVGGLLSAHLFATGELPIRGYRPKVTKYRGKKGVKWPNGFFYNGQLLRLAHDLGNRLLPAFRTATGLPYPRVNLRYGVPFYQNSPLNAGKERETCLGGACDDSEITETCSAGAGSLVLEFATLSRLTGDNRFERAAKEAYLAVWTRRSTIGLIGSGIDAETGHWVSAYTGIGAGIDSFFEYAMKSHILLSGVPSLSANDQVHSDTFLAIWEEAHAGIKRHIYRGAVHVHPHYTQVDLYTGATRAHWIDSLSAYYPGLLTLAGELEEAIETHLLYTAIWHRYSALPERWSTHSGTIDSGLRWWPGRPEFIESAWYLYRATSDPWYLHVGEMALRDIKRRCRTECGWAGLQDVRTGELTDRMESFFLGETAKYLFLLFDPSHPLNSLDSSFVFTTEGHPLVIPRANKKASSKLNHTQIRSSSHTSRPRTCPVPPPLIPLTISATAARKDLYHAANLARLHLMPTSNTTEKPLIEFTSDHPSLLPDDMMAAPPEHGNFPWTLPRTLIPGDAVSSPIEGRATFDLTFPNMAATTTNLVPVQRVMDGILVNSMSGIRLGLLYESISNGAHTEKQYRIYAIENVALGRDERVFVTREAMSNLNTVDPYFTRMKDLQVLDLLVDAPEPLDRSPRDNKLENLEVDGNVTNIIDIKIPEEMSGSTGKSESYYLSSLLQSIQDFLSKPTASPVSPRDSPMILRHHLTATLPSGPGAAPLPDVQDNSFIHSKVDQLAWSAIYLAGQLCDERLPSHIPREFQVIVIKRGGCSFSAKLHNIPTHPPNSSSLQLVIVVSYPEYEDAQAPFPGPLSSQQYEPFGRSGAAGDSQLLIQPHLDQAQFSPTGIARPHPIPLIMVGGGDATYSLLDRAKSVGIRRRWWVSCQDTRIGNLIVL